MLATLGISPLILLIGGLGLAFLVAGLAATVVGPKSVVEERLGRYSESGGFASEIAANEERIERPSPISDFLNRLGEGTDLFEGISRNLARADIKLRPAEYIVLIVASTVGAGLLGALLGKSWGFGALSAVVGIFIPGIYVGRAKAKRLKMFDNQLGDMLNLMVNGLRAGYSTLQAMEAVSRELPSPICDEFRRVVQEMQLGIPMEDALEHLLRRISSEDLDLVITAINVQREVGGNLAEILDVISYTIRERVRIKGEISALTAQGRATSWVISGLPVALMLILYFVNREYMMNFFRADRQPCGAIMLVVAGLLIVSGFLIVRKLVDIDI